MGYQEGFLRVGSLAEAAGVKVALDVLKERVDPDVIWLALTRTKVPFSYCGGYVAKGELLVCVGGVRGGVHTVTDFDLDPVLYDDGEWIEYDAVFEDLPESLLDGTIRRKPEVARRAGRFILERYVPYHASLNHSFTLQDVFDLFDGMTDVILAASWYLAAS